MKFLCVGDIHLSDVPPSSCTESYTDDLFDLIGEVRKVAETRGVAGTVLAGDIFNIKNPRANSHGLVVRTIEAFKCFPTPVWCVPGNHDMTNNRFESLAKQPLGVVLRSGAMHLLSGWTYQASFKGVDLPGQRWHEALPLYGIPWLAEWNHTDNDVRMQAVDASLAQLHSRWDGSVPILIVTHAPFYPPGLELEFENYPTKQFSKQLLDPVKGSLGVYYGHVHEAHGVYTSGGVRYANLGALSRGSLHEHNLTREISVTIWDSETNKFEVVPLPHKPADQVFDLLSAAEVKKDKLDLSEFVDDANATHIQMTSVEQVIEEVRRIPDIEQAVVVEVEDLLLNREQ